MSFGMKEREGLYSSGGGNINGKQFNEGCKVEFNQPSCWLYSMPKFSCILAISNPVFRWESCKGSV